MLRLLCVLLLVLGLTAPAHAGLFFNRGGCSSCGSCGSCSSGQCAAPQASGATCANGQCKLPGGFVKPSPTLADPKTAPAAAGCSKDCQCMKGGNCTCNGQNGKCACPNCTCHAEKSVVKQAAPTTYYYYSNSCDSGRCGLFGGRCRSCR